MSNLSFQVDLAAAFIALLALVFSLRISARQARLERESMRQQRDSDIITWSNDSLANVCRAEMLLRPEYVTFVPKDEYEQCRFEVLAQISCCIDRGGLFFPNREADRIGLSKEAAFRGKRHAVLDRLVWIYELLSSVTHESPPGQLDRKAVREKAIALKREFISEVQSEVDPRRRVKFIENHS